MQYVYLSNAEGREALIWQHRREGVELPWPREFELTWNRPGESLRVKIIEQLKSTNDFLGFYSESHKSGLRMIHVPYWPFVLLTGGLAILLKPKPRLRFSLRELLLLTTIAAIVFGTIAALPKLANV